ncbi:MAG TPA: lactonase family protein [Acidobacteriaceae bacterium]|jgi:6-phosphogluconolactonase|nr:lactonase family protein [Acidobacteriaceae bacterium]
MGKLNRREFVRLAAVAPAAVEVLQSRTKQEEKRRLLFVGTQTVEGSTSRGIYAFQWDPATGDLRPAGLAAESDNPTFLAIDADAKFLYAANEIASFQAQASGAVSAFAIDHAGAKLKAINKVASLGTGTCHVTVDHLGRAAFCANYSGGSASSFVINYDGQITDAVSHFQYHGHGPNNDRQEAPHAHRVTVSPDDRFLLVNDLGLDCIHIYHLNDANAKLTPNQPPQWNATPGSGPRALRFHPNGRFAYCIHELISQVEVLAWDRDKGTLESVEKVHLIPDDFHGVTRGGDIVITRDGHFAYAANRDYDCLVSFALDPKSGKLTFLARTSCGGKIPRHLALDPTEKWVLVANEQSDHISVFARDEKTGKVAEAGKDFPISKPQCLVFA